VESKIHDLSRTSDVSSAYQRHRTLSEHKLVPNEYEKMHSSFNQPANAFELSFTDQNLKVMNFSVTLVVSRNSTEKCCSRITKSAICEDPA